MKAPYLLAIPMILVVFAGCFGDEPAPPPVAPPEEQVEAPVPPTPPDFDWASAIHVTHEEGAGGHALWEQHAGIVGMEQLDFYDLSGGMRYQAMVSGQYNEVDICGTMGVVGSFAGNRGFTLVNVTNGTNLSAFAQYATMSTNWDVRFTPDCQVVVVGMELGVLGQSFPVPEGQTDLPEFPQLPVSAPNVNAWQDAGRGGLILVDVSVPASPKRIDYVDTGSVHNLFTASIDNVTYVVINTGGIYRLVGEGADRTLEKVAEIPGSHDVHVARHPETGHPYLFTGYEGLAIYDFADPAAPELVANLEFPEGHTAWHEQTPAPAMLDGRWVLVGAGENQGGMPEPFSVVNITDPTAPEFLGSWMLPGDFSAHDTQTAFYTFSPHNVAIRDDGRVALANYHAGTWVIDISTKERQESPVTLGFALPNNEAPGIMRSLPYAPYVWGGAWGPDNSLWIADLNSGMYSYAVP